MKKKMNIGIILLCVWVMLPIGTFALGIQESETVTLEKCIDGDTARFQDENGNSLKTRFLAIDTPETVHPTKKVEAFGKEASNYTCESLKNAKEIRLEYDNDSDKEDKYGRRLAWVFVDGVLLQEKLIELGYAKVAYLYGDYEYTTRLQEVEAKVKAEEKGIWSIEDTKQERKETPKKTTSKKENKKTSQKKKKNWLQDLIDYALAEIFKYINEILENIAKFVESML